MADGEGIIQEVELRLSAATAKQLETQIQAALKKGTDATGAKQNLDEVDKHLKKVGESGINVQRILERIGIYFGVYELIDKVKELAKGIVEASIEFEQLRAELKVFTGDTASATKVLETLEELSKELPFSVRDLTSAYVSLRNVGITPTTEQFKNLAGIAAGLNKPITEVFDAIAMAVQGVPRGLTQLGIRAKVEGDQLALTFRGVTTSITNNAASILDYMDKLGASKFGTASAEQVNTLGGAWGQFTKTVNRLFEAIGAAGLTKALTDATKALTAYLTGISEGTDKQKLFALNVQYTIDVIRLFGYFTIAALDTLFAPIIMVIKGFESLTDAVLGTAKAIAGDFAGAVASVKDARDRFNEGAAAGNEMADAWKRAFGFANEADRRLAQNQVHAAGFDLAVQWNKGVSDGLNVGPTTSVRAAFGLKEPGAKGEGSLGPYAAPTSTIPSQGGLSPDKVLDMQKQLLAEIIKEADERAKIAGITNKEIDQYAERLAIVKQEQDALDHQQALLAKTLQTGTMSDTAREKAVGKLETMVHQSKALQDEAARLLSLIQLRQPLAASNANNVPGKGGGLNAGVDAANAASGIGDTGIMGLHGGMTADQWAQQGGILDDQHNARLDEMTQKVDLYGEAWKQAFFAIGQGKNVFKELERAVGTTLSLIAQELAKTEIAKGVADLAEGTWPPNPVALAAAGKHFAAALLFEAVAGGASMIGAGGGGGGGGSYSQSGNVGGSAAQNAPTERPPFIHLTVNAFDPRNPVHQNYLGDAISQYVERVGGTVVFGGTR